MSSFRKILMASIAVATVAGQAYAQDVKVLRIGLDGGENEADQVRRTECVKPGLIAATGVSEVQIFPSPNYNGVIQGLLGGTIDMAMMGASSYASIYLKDPNAVTPVLTTKQEDGSTGYYSIMVARKDSGIKTLADAKGKKLGFADPDSTSGYLVPLTQIPKDTGMPNDQFFASTQFNGGHENNLLAAYDGKVDVAVDDSSGLGDFKDGYTSGTFRKEVDKGAVDPNKLVEVWRSPLIPNGPLVVRNELGEEWQKKLAAFFTALPEKDHKCFTAIEGGDYKGYAPVTHEFYNAVVDVRKAAIGG